MIPNFYDFHNAKMGHKLSEILKYDIVIGYGKDRRNIK